MSVLNRKSVGVPEGSVYIGRGSKWGNPFVMKHESDRDEVVSQYKAWLKESIIKGKFSLEELATLHGKDLVCYCAPKACHGDSLAKVALWAFQQLN